MTKEVKRDPEELARLEKMDRKMIYVSAKNERDFWSQVDTSAEGDEGHWIWLGGYNNQGHPTTTIDGETFGPHRLSWVLHTGEEHPSYSRIRRKCGNRKCVRPEHLKITRRDYAQHLGTRPRHRFTVLALEKEATSRKPRLSAADMGPTPGQQRFAQLVERMESLENTVKLSNRTVTNHLSQHREALERSTRSNPQSTDIIERKVDALTSMVSDLLELLSRREGDSSPASDPLTRLDEPTPEPPEPTPDETEESSDSKEESDEQLDAALTEAFGQGPLTEEGLRSLRRVFQLAMVEAKKESVDAGSTFYDWVSQYRDLAFEAGSGPTPEGLYRAVASGNVA